MERVTRRYHRIDSEIWDQPWFASLSMQCQAIYLKLCTTCDMLGVVEAAEVPESLIETLTEKGLILIDGKNCLLCDFIKNQAYRRADIPMVVYAFAECPFPKFKEFLQTHYKGLFSEERLDRYNRGVLVRDLHIPFSAWRRIRTQVFERDAYTCRYCGQHTESPHCDHVIPLCKGGETTLENLVTACPACNCSKHDKTPEEWRGQHYERQG